MFPNSPIGYFPFSDHFKTLLQPCDSQGLQKTPKSEMASIALRSRLVSRLTKFGSRNPRISLTEASPSNPLAKVPGLASYHSSYFSDTPPPNQPPPPPPTPLTPPPEAAAAAAESLGKERKGLKILSYGLMWALTGATAAVGYASYGPC